MEEGVHFRVRFPRFQELEPNREAMVHRNNVPSQLPPNYTPVADDTNHVANPALVTLPEVTKELHFHGPGTYDIRTA